ncbi:MFS transporter [Natronolimnobius sp. AArcel1]|uniref:MFS transporter n=1 Tax=Natronolimnobius sp. AArcel1 TaxID=1679093 RepID=UPI0013EDCC42|nr:MFS transporter [Natronolimnobius sp. AArcel1]NGM67859.1 MFS transporter [Natronolimnobius sp. AArcel1]
MVSLSSIIDGLRSPRTALLLNVALVMAGSVLALVGYFDLVTGLIVVTAGLLGMGISLIGRQSDE